MKRRLLIFIMITALIICSIPASSVIYAYPYQIQVYLDGEKVEIPEGEPEILYGSTFVPIRFISEEMGYTVLYDDTTKSVSVGEIFSHIIGTSFVTMSDGQEIEIGLKSYLKDSRTMVPIRFFAETLGALVSYDGECHMAIISTSYEDYESDLTARHIHTGDNFILSDGTYAPDWKESLVLVRDGGELSIERTELFKTTYQPEEKEISSPLHHSLLIALGGSSLNISDTYIETGGVSAIAVAGEKTHLNIKNTTIKSMIGEYCIYVGDNAEVTAEQIEVTAVTSKAAICIDTGAFKAKDMRLFRSGPRGDAAAISVSGKFEAENLLIHMSGYPAMDLKSNGEISLTESSLRCFNNNLFYINDAENTSIRITCGEIFDVSDIFFKISDSTSNIFLTDVSYMEIMETRELPLKFMEVSNSNVSFNTDNQIIKYEIVCIKSNVTFHLENSSVLSSAITQTDDSALNIYLDSSSKWILESDIYVNVLSDADSEFNNIQSNGYTIFYNSDSNPELEEKTYNLDFGGKLQPQ